MAKVVERGTCAQEGIGKPDYSKDVSSSLERAGLRLKYGQRLKIFGRQLTLGGDPDYPLFPTAPLAAGDNTHLTDAETLDELPITIDAGWILSFLAASAAVTQDAQIYSIIDSYWANCWVATEGGIVSYMNKLIDISTAWIDPDADDPHTIDIKLYNMGTGNLFGGVGVICILEPLGTMPLPTTKVCRCPHCGNKEEFPVTTTKIICSACGKLYIVSDFSRFRGTP